MPDHTTSSAPRVSVVIPTHNRAELLPRAVYSVLAQTWEDFELIIEALSLALTAFRRDPVGMIRRGLGHRRLALDMLVTVVRRLW